MLISGGKEISKARLLKERIFFTTTTKIEREIKQGILCGNFLKQGILCGNFLNQDVLCGNLKVYSGVEQIFHHRWVFIGRRHVENILAVIPEKL